MTIYTDFDSGTIIDNLYPGSPLWVGAWWLGFVISAGASWICALIIGKIVKHFSIVRTVHVTPLRSMKNLREIAIDQIRAQKIATYFGVEGH